MASEGPFCGCSSDVDAAGFSSTVNDDCLYPQAVSRVTELESQVSAARLIILSFLVASSWQGSPECKVAELFLERTKP